MPFRSVNDRFVKMPSGHLLSCELHGRNSGHIVYCLGAIQCGNPEPEVSHYLQTGRIHRVEQRRKVTTVTVDNSRIMVRKCRSPPLSPDGTRVRSRRVTLLEVENPGIFRVSPHDVDMDVWYPRKSGEVFFRAYEVSVDIPGDKLRSVDRNALAIRPIQPKRGHFTPPF